MGRHALPSLAVAVLLVAFPSAGSTQTLQERLGHPASARLLILHSDDLGMNHSVNRATFEALERGWITSASILVPCPWFPEVARWAREHPEADLGIHLALNSEWTDFRWGPISGVDAVPSLLDADGYLPLIEPTVAKNAKPAEAERELRAQMERARAAGIKLTHIDTHMNTLFQTAGLFDVYKKMGKEYGLPLRLDRSVLRPPEGSSVDPGDIVLDSLVALDAGVPLSQWREAYQKLLSPLKPGVHLVVLHLAYSDDEMRAATWDHPDWGAAWRQADLDMVKSAAFRDYLKREGFVLVSWKDLAKATSAAAE